MEKYLLMIHLIRISIWAVFISATALSSQPLSAGSWSSGGGEILEHAQNPWVLDGPGGSGMVKYCVMSGGEFPVSPSTLENLVANTIQWWDRQFSNAFTPQNQFTTSTGVTKNFPVLVNTSRFVLEPCGPGTDLAFQFGILTDEQQLEFNRQQIDLTRYVALTIRTDYSENLRGKGFIYVSPDRGPSAFRGQNVRENAWTNQDHFYFRLTSVITHELGHVFGLTHAATDDSIMGAKFAEFIVSKIYDLTMINALSGLYQSVFFPKTSKTLNEYCEFRDDLEQFRKFFEIPDEMKCFRFGWELNSLSIEVKLDQDSAHWQRIGVVRFADGGKRRHQNLVKLWIPAVQSVFPDLPMYATSLSGPASSEVLQTGRFLFDSGSPAKAIFVQASPRHFQVGGAANDGIFPDLLPKAKHGSPLSGWDEY